jgi:hypothetical protein
MEAEKSNVTCDPIGIFSGKYRPKNKPMCYCFYATIKGKSQKQREVNGVIILVMRWIH